MAEEKEQQQQIVIARPGMPIEEMRRVAETEKEQQRYKEGPGTLVNEFKRFADIQVGINKAYQDQTLKFEEAITLSQKHVADLVESTKLLTPEEERSRWTDSEYDQEFYTRFQPNQEPHFYTKLETKERELYDARWQLARAAFVKKLRANFPDKYRENDDLTLLGKEQMEKLYKMPGVRKMLEGYAKTIVEGDAIKVVDEDGSRRSLSFWNIKSATDFEKFRIALRKAKIEPLGLDKISEKAADAVAWNLIWVSNLVESVDSRYSFSGESHRDLPGIICAGEHKYALHPQERFEGKCVSGHFWGVFGTWGVNQLNRIKSLYGSKDEFKFVPAPRGRYWWSELTNRLSSKGGRIVVVYAPECYPVTTAGSFFEETTFHPNGKEESLLDRLLAQKEIPWDNNTLGEDMWSSYAAAKFNKAVQLMAYFEGDVKLSLIEGKESDWVFPVIELFTRLKFNKVLDKLTERKKDKSGRDLPPKSNQTFHNLKIWAVIAGKMGVRKLDVGDVTAPFRLLDSAVLSYRLHHTQLGPYLGKNESLSIT